MIFATVGMQMPFDRLIRAADAWAASRGRDDVLAQTGETDLRPAHVDWMRFVDVAEYRGHLSACDVVVTHAGMGTVLTALEFAKPIIMMPRRHELRETRNDHQLATARSLARTAGIRVAWDEKELTEALDAADTIPSPTKIGRHASTQLLSTIRGFIQGEPVPARDDDELPPQPVVHAPWFTESQERRAA